MLDYSVVVLTGGYGTRLSSVVADRPKILAPIGDTEFIHFFIKWLKVSRVSIDNVIFAAGYLGSQVNHIIERDYSSMTVIVESIPNGTFKALVGCINCAINDDILVLNGDTIFQNDFRLMHDYYSLLDPDQGLLALKSVASSSSSHGFDIINGRTMFRESPFNFTSLGALFTSKRAILSAYSKFYSKDKNAKLMIDSHFITQIRPYPYVLTPTFFVDIGTPDSLLSAQSLIPFHLNV